MILKAGGELPKKIVETEEEEEEDEE